MSFKVEIKFQPGATKTVEKMVPKPARLYFKIYAPASLPSERFSVRVDDFNLTWNPTRTPFAPKWNEKSRVLSIDSDGYIDEIGNLFDVVPSEIIRKAFTQLAEEFETYYHRLEREAFADYPKDAVDLLHAPVWTAFCNVYFAIIPASQEIIPETLAEPDDIYFNIVGIDPRSLDSVPVQVTSSSSDFDLVLELETRDFPPGYYNRSQEFVIDTFGWLSEMLPKDRVEDINMFRKHFTTAEIEGAFEALAAAIVEQYAQQQAQQASRQRKPPPSNPKTWIASASTTLALVKTSE